MYNEKTKSQIELLSSLNLEMILVDNINLLMYKVRPLFLNFMSKRSLFENLPDLIRINSEGQVLPLTDSGQELEISQKEEREILLGFFDGLNQTDSIELLEEVFLELEKGISLDSESAEEDSFLSEMLGKKPPK